MGPAVTLCLTMTWSLTTAWVVPAFGQQAAATPGEDSLVEPAADAATTASERSQRLTRGLKAYQAGDHPRAVAELTIAAEENDAAALLALGYAAAAAGDHARAQRALERYLDDHGAALSLAVRNQVEKRLEDLRGKTAYVSVRSNVKDADVLVDGILVARTQTPALLVTAGEHDIVLRHERLAPVSTTVDLDPRQDEIVVLEFEAPERFAVATVEVPAPAGPEPVALWLPWTAAGILTAGAGGLAALTFTTSRSVDALKRNPTATDAQVEDANARVLALAVTTGVISGLAVGVLGTSLYLTLSDSRGTMSDSKGTLSDSKSTMSDSKGGSEPPRTSGVDLELRCSPAGISFDGRF